MKSNIFFANTHSVLAVLLVCAGCSTVSPPHPDKSVTESNSDATLALLWSKYAAEARALYYQGYNVAKDRLYCALKENSGGERLAVIVDIDETVLNSVPFQNSLFSAGAGFLSAEGQLMWHRWLEETPAEALPGAREFLSFAVSKGVEVFYISSRSTNDLEATLKNLRLRNFPMADKEHVLLQKAHEGKEPNRKRVGSSRKVVLLIGDDLNDLSEIFQNKTVRERFELTDGNREEFGRRFIVFPNPMYGHWENAIYRSYGKGLSSEQTRQELFRGERPVR